MDGGSFSRTLRRKLNCGAALKNLVPITRAPARVLRVDPVACEVRMAAANDEPADTGSVERISQVPHGYPACAVADSAFQEVVLFFRRKRTARTSDEYPTCLDQHRRIAESREQMGGRSPRHSSPSCACRIHPFPSVVNHGGGKGWLRRKGE